MMLFRDDEHQKAYEELCSKLPDDVYYNSLAYLLTLDTVCRQNVTALLDDTPTDYLLIGVYDSFEELDKACARFQRMKFAREEEELPAEFIPPAPRVPSSDAGARRLAEVF